MQKKTFEELDQQIDAIHNAYPANSAEYRAILGFNSLLIRYVRRADERPAILAELKTALLLARSPELRRDMQEIADLFTQVVRVCKDAAREECQ